MIQVRRMAVAAALLVLALAQTAAAQGSVTGVVTDSLGERVANATVTLTGGSPAETKSGADGTYRFANVAPGRYQVVATAPGFTAANSESIYVGSGDTPFIALTVQVGPLKQAEVVTAAAVELPQAQTGAPVTVIDATTLDSLNKVDVLEALRLVPGAQVLQTGGRGGPTSFFIRGGNSNFNKVLIDGIVANDIGGGFDFAQLSTTGVEQVEVMRQTNSVLYGSDALAGVVSIATRHGRTRTPELTMSVDGGNLGTWKTDAGFGGVVNRTDYFFSASRFETDNDVRNNAYENATFAGRVGVATGGNTHLSATARHTDTTSGSPNAITLYGVPDDSTQERAVTYIGATAQTQFSNRLQSTVRFGWAEQELSLLNPTASGTAYDPFGFGASYIGETVSLRGHNGYSTTGTAILDFPGMYPSMFESKTRRYALSGQISLALNNALTIAGGARYDREEGFNALDADEPEVTRNNGGVFGEIHAAILNRTHVTAGVGIEHNEAFGEAVTPRISVASYIRQPSSTGIGETKLVLNAGTGIKAPSVFHEQASLYALLNGLPAGEGIEPIGPERSRSFDIGVEQAFAGSRARLRVSYFHNSFRDLIEFLNKGGLVAAGVPPDVAAATDFGAAVNSQSYRAQGAELEFEALPIAGLRVLASYTYVDAEVTEAFNAAASFNPAFPDIAIGQFSPLVGARPFWRPAHSGTLLLSYAKGPADIVLTTLFAGARDDSTFAYDQDFGTSMLLPNRDLAEPYQKVDLSGAWAVHPRLRLYTSIENLFDEDYEAAFGFPSLPLTARLGVRVTIGGDSHP